MNKFNPGDTVRVTRQTSNHFGKTGQVMSVHPANVSTEGNLNRVLLSTGQRLSFYDRNLDLVEPVDENRPPMFSKMVKVAQPIHPTPWNRVGSEIWDATGLIVFEANTPEVAEEIKSIIETHVARSQEQPPKAPAQFFSDRGMTPDVFRLDNDGTWTFQAYPYDEPIQREPESHDWENIRPIRVADLDEGYFVKDQEAAK